MFKLSKKIKLVIWDLDETFWKGTLSEGGIEYRQDNHDFIIELTNRGIVNSISSKNDFSNVKKELQKFNIWEYIVFPSIDWQPKGQMVKQIISKMNLRAENVLFLDDNLLNLNEVEFMNKGINLAHPDHLKEVMSSEYLIGKDDSSHSRLLQYKILENKVIDFESSTGSNIDFLKDSNIIVNLNYDCMNEIDRIYELVERTNQLNYTKLRDSKEILLDKISDTNNKSGYISVKDKYGEYGIVGFYLIINEKLEHFLFSCRILNMYIETWLYKKIKAPKLNIIGEVAAQLNIEQDTAFISELCNVNFNAINSKDVRVEDNELNNNILLMGGCDLDQVVYYLNSNKIETEFNYVNKNNLNVHKDHTYLIKQFTNYNKEFNEVIKNIPVLSIDDINLKINTNNWDIMIFSPLNDYSRGLYKHKKTGFILPFDAFNIDWTDETNWLELPKHLTALPISFLKNLKNNFEFMGSITPCDFSNNIQWLINNYENKKFIFLNGSIIKLDNIKPWEKDMDKRHIEMNQVLYEIESKNDNVFLVDIPKIINGESDYHTDNIRHYNKILYKKIADTIVQILKEKIGIKKITSSSIQSVFFKKLYRKVNYQFKKFKK